MPTRGRRRRSDEGTRGADLSAKQLAEIAYDLARVETRPGVAADVQEACFHQMEEELANRQRELNRLRELLKYASRDLEPEVKDAVSLAEEAVGAQEKKLAEYLDARPWLLEKLYNSEPMTDENEELSDHLPEKDWRRHIASLMTNKEKQWLEQLQEEQEKRIQAWQAIEYTRQQSQCEQLQRAMLERHERMEAEWRQKLEGAQQTQLRGWMEEERERMEEILSEQMARIAQEARERERGWLKQLRAELEKVENELQEQHKLELRLMEIEWREQEVLQRERGYLRKREQEMLDAQQQRLEHVSQQLCQALVPNQERRLAEWLDLQAEEWNKRRNAWHLELNQQNERALRILTEEHRVTIETTSKELVDELRSVLLTDREHLQKTHDDWLRSQQEALTAVVETWEQRHLVRLGELGEEWNKRLLDEQTEQRNAYDIFSRQLNEDRLQAISEAQAEVRNSTLTILQRFAEEHKDAEAKREELWKRHVDRNLEGMKSDWMEFRQAALEQYQLLRDEQSSRISALDQLSRELAERFAESEVKRQQSWTARSSSALEELATELRQYFEERTITAIASLDDKGDQLLRSLEEDVASLKQSLCDDVGHRQEALADGVHRWLHAQHALLAGELREMISAMHNDALSGLTNLLQQQIDENLHKLEKEVDMVLQEQREQTLERITADINQSLEEMRQEMTERYLQELAKCELNLQERFMQQMELATTALKEQFKDLWKQQADEYTRLHQSELAEQQGRALSRFEQSVTHECQRLRERYEQIISELREGIRSKQEAEMKAVQDAAYREYRIRLDQIVEELTSDHRNELTRVVQERDARLVTEIRQNLKAEIQKQLEEERKERLTKAAQPIETTRRSKRTRR